jgi:hypothetical protein
MPYFSLAMTLTATPKNGITMALIKHACFKTPDLPGQNTTRSKLVATSGIAMASALRMAPLQMDRACRCIMLLAAATFLFTRHPEAYRQDTIYLIIVHTDKTAL